MKLKKYKILRKLQFKLVLSGSDGVRTFEHAANILLFESGKL